MHVYTQCPGSQRHQTKATSVTPRAPFLDTSLPLYFLQSAYVQIRTGAYGVHTDAWYILQRHCSRIVIRHMHAWPTYGIRSQTEVLASCSVPTYKQGFRRNSDHSAEFLFYFPDIQSTEYFIHHA